MSTSELLLWLNDRRGKEIEAEIVLERDGYSVTVMRAIGELRHWSEEDHPDVEDARRLAARDDLAGWYTIGLEARVDVTDIGDAAVFLDGSEIEVEIVGPAVTLHLREHPPE